MSHGRQGYIACGSPAGAVIFEGGGTPLSHFVTARQQLRTGLACNLLVRLSSHLRLQTAHWAVCLTSQPQRGEQREVRHKPQRRRKTHNPGRRSPLP
ncbi:hypothetical protein DVB78_00480 [Bifidobacterium longum subsp. longum]|nr:hypothetical protein DVB78_00480 [Bifidobacterium longum subsp. longum]